MAGVQSVLVEARCSMVAWLHGCADYSDPNSAEITHVLYLRYQPPKLFNVFEPIDEVEAVLPLSRRPVPVVTRRRLWSRRAEKKEGRGSKEEGGARRKGKRIRGGDTSGGPVEDDEGGWLHTLHSVHSHHAALHACTAWPPFETLLSNI